MESLTEQHDSMTQELQEKIIELAGQLPGASDKEEFERAVHDLEAQRQANQLIYE